MHKLVSPEGVLHLLPLDDRSILSFTRAHGLKDKKYLMKHLHGEQDESYGWQLLAKVKWLKHSSGVVVPVVGKATHFFDARAAVCERAGIDSTLMPWDAKDSFAAQTTNAQKLLVVCSMFQVLSPRVPSACRRAQRRHKQDVQAMPRPDHGSAALHAPTHALIIFRVPAFRMWDARQATQHAIWICGPSAPSSAMCEPTSTVTVLTCILSHV